MAGLKRLAMAAQEEYLVMDARSRSLTDRGPELVAAVRCELGERVTAGHRPAQAGVDTVPTADSAGLRSEPDWLRGRWRSPRGRPAAGASPPGRPYCPTTGRREPGDVRAAKPGKRPSKRGERE
ncbi:hypothetical protein AB0F11_34685 [Streptomyces sp. NPDC032472]|uniref:hypothetical protein n=1 Tax=Streptomyces sp. NPDC032472 TaxID=3155018 RepID=UPI0033EE06CA